MSMWGGGFVQASAAKKASAQQAAAIREGIAEQKRQYDLGVARMAPYETFGREQGMNRFADWLKAGDQPGGGVTIDPGYDWRREQGLKGVEGTAAGSQMLKSGDTLRALENYGQGLASQEYGNAFGRRMQTGGMLQSVMGSGQNAASGQNALGTNFANQTSQAQGQIGGAEARGTMGAADAYSGMLSQAGNLALKGAGAWAGGGYQNPFSNIFASKVVPGSENDISQG